MKVRICNTFSDDDLKSVIVVETRKSDLSRDGIVPVASCILAKPGSSDLSMGFDVTSKKWISVYVDSLSGLPEIPPHHSEKSFYTVTFPKILDDNKLITFQDESHDKFDNTKDPWIRKYKKKHHRKTEWGFTIKYPENIDGNSIEKLEEKLAGNHTVEVGDNDQ